MSPLVRSLLALAALLAAAQAYGEYGNCTRVYKGDTSGEFCTSDPKRIPSPGKKIEIIDDCYKWMHTKMIGEQVLACNYAPNGRAPDLHVSDDYVHLDMRCHIDNKGNSDCPLGLIYRYRLYCDPTPWPPI